MALGQRALLAWFLQFLSLAFLALYLVRISMFINKSHVSFCQDIGFEPLVFFIFLWLTDLVTLVFLVLRCIRHFSSNGPNRSGEENSLVADMPKLNPSQTIMAASKH
jgi:uncharacterized Tic20 family protein